MAYLLMKIDANINDTFMILEKPEEVCKTLKGTCQAVSEAAVDAKLSQMQQLRMISLDPVINYSNSIQSE